jgi:anti-sigma B factor antagonist
MSDQAGSIERGLLTILSEPHSTAALVTVRGEMDGSNARDLEDELIRLDKEGRSQIVLDVSRLEFIDSTGLAVLVRAHRRIERDHHILILVRPQGLQVVRAFELSGLDEALFFVD